MTTEVTNIEIQSVCDDENVSLILDDNILVLDLTNSKKIKNKNKEKKLKKLKEVFDNQDTDSEQQKATNKRQRFDDDDANWCGYDYGFMLNRVVGQVQTHYQKNPILTINRNPIEPKIIRENRLTKFINYNVLTLNYIYLYFLQ
jgi:hypothetical protein